MASEVVDVCFVVCLVIQLPEFTITAGRDDADRNAVTVDAVAAKATINTVNRILLKTNKDADAIIQHKSKGNAEPLSYLLVEILFSFFTSPHK